MGGSQEQDERDEQDRQAKQLFRELVGELIRRNRDSWQEAKADLATGGVCDLYGSYLGTVFLNEACRLLAACSPQQRALLEAYARRRLPPEALDRSCAAMMVGEVMTRAQRAANRYG